MASTVRQLKQMIRSALLHRFDEPRLELLLQAHVRALWEEHPWSFRQGEAVLMTVAPKTTGTVTLNVDTTRVDGTGTAFTATDVGKQFRGPGTTGTFYRVVAVTGQQLTLEVPWVGAAFTASAYTLFQSVYALATDVDLLLSVTDQWPLRQRSLRQSNVYDARRQYNSGTPWAFTPRGEDASGTLLVEIAPVPSSVTAIRYYFQRKPPALVDSVHLPFPDLLLVYRTASDGLMVLAGEKPDASSALLAIAQGYELKAAREFQDFQYKDFQKIGIQEAVHDESEDMLWDDSVAWSHDIGGLLW